MLPPQGAWVLFLTGKLKFYIPCGRPKNFFSFLIKKNSIRSWEGSVLTYLLFHKNHLEYFAHSKDYVTTQGSSLNKNLCKSGHKAGACVISEALNMLFGTQTDAVNLLYINLLILRDKKVSSKRLLKPTQIIERKNKI